MIQISKKVIVVFVSTASLVVVIYFGILIYKQLKPQTPEQKIMHCLELGSDQRASTCIKIVRQETALRHCSFKIADVKEYSGRYGERGAYYKSYEGIIKNTSDRKEHLRAMIGKLYTPDKVLVKTEYTRIEEDVDSGVSLTFKINIQSSSNEENNSFDGLTKDIYPWFTTCE